MLDKPKTDQNAASEGTGASHCSVEFNTDYRANAVCPHCGYKDEGSWEIDFGDTVAGDAECDCPNCDEPYIVKRNVTVDYSTRKKPNVTLEPQGKAKSE